MAQLDVYPNPDLSTADDIPYLLDIQSGLLHTLPGCVVVPLANPESLEALPILRLNPKLEVAGSAVVMLTQELATLPRRALKTPVANLSAQRDEILAALDLLFTGF
ncbi:MAG: CcdB family protein [Rhodocyclaceae bacterium]|nr:CcdB family protein [Rhodocyclaceae bacterium]MDP1957285.1 CcdB family protein [Rhodocyclaceae bacterium]